MSLVGTRPILQDELEQYELHHRARIATKPGITGMWQVSGRSNITDFEEVVRLDTEYISYIKDVHFERKNDNYLSGLEYLSSIILLSRCTALVGGNCGGTLGALFFNDEKYEFVHVFNLGLYP